MSQSATPAHQVPHQAQAAAYRRPRSQQRTLTLPKTAKVAQEPLELDSSALFQGARESISATRTWSTASRSPDSRSCC